MFRERKRMKRRRDRRRKEKRKVFAIRKSQISMSQFTHLYMKIKAIYEVIVRIKLANTHKPLTSGPGIQ